MTAHALLTDFLTTNPLPQTHAYHKAWLEALNVHIDALVCQAVIPIDTLLRLRTLAVEQLVISLFDELYLGEYATLFAVGGFARMEMLPCSDVDMLLLYDIANKENPALQDFVAHLWNTGLTPAITLRPTNDSGCVDDITIATNLSENRFLAGNQDFANLPSVWVKNHWTIQHFFTQKHQEYRHRHAHHGNTEYNLEPNVKSSVGTLRDIHLLHWIGKFYFDLPPQATLADFVKLQFLTQDECDTLMNAKHFFWQIRHHLHTLSGKADDRLSFGMQKLLAQRMGFGEVIGNDTSAPEQLMKHYYHHAMTVATLTGMLTKLFFETYLDTSHQSIPLQGFEGQFALSHHHEHTTIAVQDPKLFTTHPHALLGIFLAMGKHHIKHISPLTMRLLRRHSHDIDDAFRNNRICQRLFLDNLNEPNFLFHRLRLMKRSGILGAYLPDFAKITGLMQYDLFHRYTVDAHTLLLIRILHRFGRDDEFGVISTVYRELDNKLPLIIAGLFHDIAKGRKGDHSELGADLVLEFCQTHQLPKQDADLAEWLVRHHLVMSITAQKKDVLDPDVINEFANFVGDVRHLDTLYLLTVADMNATNSQLWNNWRATLLKKLYLATHHILSTGQTRLIPSDVINANQDKAMALLRLKLAKTLPDFEKKTHALWQTFPQEYFLKETAQDIAWHTKALLEHKNNTLVLIRPHKDKSLHAHQLFIYTQNKPYLFASTVMILDNFGFGVYGANILTDSKDYALDSYVIVNKNLVNKSILEDTPTNAIQSDTDELIACLYTHLPNPESFFLNAPTPKKQRISTRLQHFNITTKVFFDTAGDTQHLHIITKDRPSLLASIGKILGKLGLWVHSAKITTLGERAEDVFLVSEPFDTPLSLERQKIVINTLKDSLDD